jgi:hypothetical protein
MNEKYIYIFIHTITTKQIDHFLPLYSYFFPSKFAVYIFIGYFLMVTFRISSE